MLIFRLFNISLPDDVLRYIGEFAAFSVTDLLVLREVTQYHKEYIDKHAGKHLRKLQTYFGASKVDLRDPIYADIRDFIPATGALSLKDFKKLKNEHLERHLTLKNLSPEKLDRILGFMLENRSYYRIVLSQNPTPNNLSEENRRQFLIRRKHFREFIMSSMLIDTRFIKFLEIIHQNSRLIWDVPFPGLTYFYRRFGKHDPNIFSNSMKSIFGSIQQALILYQWGVFNDIEIYDRAAQVDLFVSYSFFLDANIIAKIIKSLISLLFPSYGFVGIIFITIFTMLTCAFRSPTFEFMLRLDNFIYQIPPVHRFITDMITFNNRFFLLLSLLAYHCLQRALNTIEGRLPAAITEELHIMMDIMEDAILLCHTFMEEQARKRIERRNENI